jgi:hypothetical protein
MPDRDSVNFRTQLFASDRLSFLNAYSRRVVTVLVAALLAPATASATAAP